MRVVFGAVLIGALLLFATPRPLDAQLAGRTVTVVAAGEARAEPDIAVLTAGVEVREATPRAALTGATDQMRRVQTALARAGIAAEDVQTSALNLFPVFDRPVEPVSGPPQPTGYLASTTVTVTVRDLDQVEPLLDALLEAGITTLSGLQFGLSDPSALHARALAAAVRQAGPLAEAAASAAGLTLGPIETIEEQGAAVPGAVPAGLGGGPDAIQGGTLSVRVQVKVTFRVS